MEKISVLFFTETEDNTKGAIIAVDDISKFSTKKLKEKIKKEVGCVLDYPNLDFDEYITKEDFDNLIDSLSERHDGHFLDYEFYWEYVEVV